MRFDLFKAAILCGSALAVSPTAKAQDTRTLPGEVDSAAVTFDIAVPAGSEMVLDAISTSDLDPVMIITDTATGETIAEDDDGGDGVNSRVRLRGGESGRNVTVSVDGFDADFVEPGESYGGSFDLVITTREYVAPRPLAYGARQEGTILFQEPTIFTFPGVAGETVEIALSAPDTSALDPYLELRDPAGEIVAENDDTNGLNSYVRHTFEKSGEYTIAAMGLGDSTGDFVLRIREARETAAVAAQLPQQVIGIGGSGTGTLGDAYDERYAVEGAGGGLLPTYIDYRLDEEAIAAILAGRGEVTIRMSASEADDPDFGSSVDPFIELGLETPLGFAVIESDDDGGGYPDALLPIDLGPMASQPEMLRQLRIRAQPLGQGGSYTISVTPGMEQRVEAAYEVGTAEAEFYPGEADEGL